MANNLSNYQEEFLAKYLFGIAALTMPSTFFLRLHTADAGEDGTTSQVAGGSYTPQTIAFQWDATNKWVESSALVSFSGMPACTVVGFSIHSLSSGGNCYGYGAITSQVVLAGQTLEISAEALTLTPSGDMSNFTREFLLKHAYGITSLTQPAAYYLELHTAAPGLDGTANVVTGGSYARQSTTFSWNSGNNRVENAAAATYTNMPAVTVTHASLHSAVTGGNCLAQQALTGSVIVGAGNNARFSAAAFSFELR